MTNEIDLLTVIKELYNISGFRISIFDSEFNEIEAYPKEQSPFCKLIKQNEKTCLSCQQSDRAAFQKVRDTHQVALYRCRFGLYDAVAPLYSFGKLSGYMMMGQTLDTLDYSRSFVYNSAAPFFSDKKSLAEAVANVHIRAKENIVSCLSIMTICAEYITLTNRLNSNKRDLPHEVKKYIDQNYRSKLSIDLLCTHFFCSRATLLNAFKRKYGKTVNGYLTKVRVDQAAKLIVMTTHSMGEIAELSGFFDQNYFSKVFLKVIGKTPSEYRRENAKE